MVNPKDHAVATLAHIEMFPETWDQENWRCDTGMCYAGTYADLHPEIEWAEPESVFNADVFYKGQEMHVADAVAIDMGILDELDPYSSPLFSSSNQIHHLRAGVKAYINDEDIVDAIREATPEG